MRHTGNQEVDDLLNQVRNIFRKANRGSIAVKATP